MTGASDLAPTRPLGDLGRWRLGHLGTVPRLGLGPRLKSVEVQIESIAGVLATGEDSRLTWFVVCYSDGDEEHREGTLLDASELAATAGLDVVPTNAGTFRWARNPETWRDPHRAAP